MQFYLKECPKDKGDLYLDKDHYGDFLKCMQCGWQKDVKLPSKPRAPRPFNQTQYNDYQTYLEEDLEIEGGSKRRILEDLANRITAATKREIKKRTGLDEKIIEDDIKDFSDYGLINVDYRSSGKEQYSISNEGMYIMDYLMSNGTIEKEELEEDSKQVKGNRKKFIQ